MNTASDSANCGMCGRACPLGESCVLGACMGCGAAVSFANQLQTIFTATCVTGCHGGVRPADNLALGAGVSYAALVNVRSSSCVDGRLRVRPRSADQSYLLNKLEGVNLCGGGQMPLRGAALAPDQIAMFRRWICHGAPNN